MVACQAAWTFHRAVPGRFLIQRTLHADAGLVEYVRVNHCRAHIFYPVRYLRNLVLMYRLPQAVFRYFSR